MEIIPGRGVSSAKVGDSRADETRIGASIHGPGHTRAVYDTKPHLVITYTPDDKVEVVETAYSGDGQEEVFFARHL